MKKIIIASDHAGYRLKEEIKGLLVSQDYNVIDVGTDSEESVDYPDFANAMAAKISESTRGILICGSGLGMSIAANRHSHIRAALCSDPQVVKLARMHNDANVLVMGARFITFEQARLCVAAFLHTEFEGGRHIARINKIS